MRFLFSGLLILACTEPQKDANSLRNDSGFFADLEGDALSDGVWFMGTGFFPQNIYNGMSGMLLRENGESTCTVVWDISEVYPIADCSVCEYGAFTLIRGGVINQQGAACHDLQPEQYVGTSESIGISDGIPYVMVDNAWEPQVEGKGLLRADMSMLYYVYPQ